MEAGSEGTKTLTGMNLNIDAGIVPFDVSGDVCGVTSQVTTTSSYDTAGKSSTNDASAVVYDLGDSL